MTDRAIRQPSFGGSIARGDRSGDGLRSAIRKTLIVASVFLAVPFAATSASAFDWKTIANSDTLIPGTAKTFSSFNQPSISNKCFVTFRARGTGPSSPPRGVYYVKLCKKKKKQTIKKLYAAGDKVPWPNNSNAPFTEFPSFSRVDITSNFIASRGQSQPVWTYTTPSGDTKVGTAGVYYARRKMLNPRTGASLLGSVPGFWYFSVPDFPGKRFDQFPGAPVPFDKKYIAFKGNYSETVGVTTVSRTGVYFRQIYKGAKRRIKKIADSHTRIPGGTTTFGSTAPPSAAKGAVVFLGLDDEDNPTQGGIYRSKIKRPTKLRTLIGIGDKVPGAKKQRFTHFGEGLSYDGELLAFWGAWGPQMRDVKLYCPVDGNADLIAECHVQCPDVDAGGNYCMRQVPYNQGIFVRRADGQFRQVASTREKRGDYEDFLYWVFSGRPPSVGDPGAEPPRWRSSAFVAATPNGEDSASVVFKGTRRDNKEGLFIRHMHKKRIKPILLVGADVRTVDRRAPGSGIPRSFLHSHCLTSF